MSSESYVHNHERPNLNSVNKMSNECLQKTIMQTHGKLFVEREPNVNHSTIEPVDDQIHASQGSN